MGSGAPRQVQPRWEGPRRLADSSLVPGLRAEALSGFQTVAFSGLLGKAGICMHLTSGRSFPEVTADKWFNKRETDPEPGCSHGPSPYSLRRAHYLGRKKKIEIKKVP